MKRYEKPVFAVRGKLSTVTALPNDSLVSAEP